MKRQLLSGNEAVARGAYEASVAVGTAYPGTPSTEILERLATYKGVRAESNHRLSRIAARRPDGAVQFSCPQGGGVW